MLQSISTGEGMSAAEKGGHGAANTFDWKVPMLMACNNFPRWAGADPEAIANRSLIFKFDCVVHDRDSTLPQQLAAQMPAIMYRAAWTYLTFSSQYPVLNSNVPGMAYFDRQMAAIKGAVSVDARFVVQCLEVEPGAVLLMEDLRCAYDEFLAGCTRQEKWLSSFNHVQSILRTDGRSLNAANEYEGIRLV